MVGTVFNVENLINPDAMASEIALKWVDWNNLRSKWVAEKKELRNYLYATDTSTTSNAMLPWSNTTTIPKLTQIKDNLHANYFATLFPNSKWMRWEGDDEDSVSKDKRETIQAYMENKVRQSGFIDTCSTLLDDFIQYGNCFGYVSFEDYSVVKESGEVIPGYVGPKLNRISPFDIVFNPTASDFKRTPKIVRAILSLGEVKKIVDTNPNSPLADAFTKMISNRQTVAGVDSDVTKGEAYTADGFSDIKMYYSSNYVEVLTFYGDIYNTDTGDFMPDRIVTVVDRAYVTDNSENPSWLGESPIFHTGWRDRPDNLYSMGPLDNLVGMQYRLDHLENLKADVFDQIAYPMLKIKGDVEEFDFQPGERIIMGEEGDVGYLRPDTTALNADLQIQLLEAKMEEMAGAPKQAMGIRTPGEKTAFEVQALENSAGRIFQHKTAHWERTFEEPILNNMLEVARRHMNYSDTIRVLDDKTGVFLFENITKEDITAKGKIIPVGARHFAERAQRLQNITQMNAIKMQDPTVAPHLSGKMMAEIMATELGESELYGENIAIFEQMETQQVAQEAQVQAEETQQIAIEQGI